MRRLQKRALWIGYTCTSHARREQMFTLEATLAFGMHPQKSLLCPLIPTALYCGHKFIQGFSPLHFRNKQPSSRTVPTSLGSTVGRWSARGLSLTTCPPA
eukprot:4545771-Pleurochrysis_carterae.AAC.2